VVDLACGGSSAVRPCLYVPLVCTLHDWRGRGRRSSSPPNGSRFMAGCGGTAGGGVGCLGACSWRWMVEAEQQQPSENTHTHTHTHTHNHLPPHTSPFAHTRRPFGYCPTNQSGESRKTAQEEATGRPGHSECLLPVRHHTDRRVQGGLCCD
jgi:hypothetical protein